MNSLSRLPYLFFLVATSVSPLAAATNVDLSLLIDDGSDFAPGGGVAHYLAILHNAGPDASVGASLHVTFPANVSGVTWTCVTDAQLPCPVPQGVGGLSQTVNIAAGASLIYRLDAEIKASPEHDLIVSGRVRSHGTEAEATSIDNDATDVDAVGLFAAGFED